MKLLFFWYGMVVLLNICIVVRIGVVFEFFGDFFNKFIDIVFKEIFEIFGVFVGEFDFIDS